MTLVYLIHPLRRARISRLERVFSLVKRPDRVHKHREFPNPVLIVTRRTDKVSNSERARIRKSRQGAKANAPHDPQAGCSDCTRYVSSI